VRVDLGAGKERRKGWVHVGHESTHYAKNIVDIDVDFMSCERMPINSNIVEAVYCGHTLEHLPNHRAQWLINEAYRILEPGGIFRVVLPDAGAAMNAVVMNARAFFSVYDGGHYEEKRAQYRLKKSLVGAPIEQYLLMMCATQLSEYIDTDFSTTGLDAEVRKCCEIGNLDSLSARCTMTAQREYPWMHCNWFNDGKLARMMAEAGFKMFFVSGHRKSFSPHMRGSSFDALPELSLHMEAFK